MAVGIFAIFGCLVLNPCKVGGLDFSKIRTSTSRLCRDLIIQIDSRISNTLHAIVLQISLLSTI